MNKQEINKTFFEDLHKSQINTVNDSIIEDAATVILRLLYFISTSDKSVDMKKDETIIEALKWLKNHKTK
jgi:tRNA nucleotidyltransferase/poly(A) polymerase